MSIENLRHTPEFELPPHAPASPADLISLIEECHEGLHKVLVHKMIRRGQYESICTIICQENPSKRTTPDARPEEIADYAMACMQHEIEKSDDPGTYRVQLIGPPGNGRFQRSKHVNLSGGDGEARSTTMVKEEDLLGLQTEYIGELQSQVVAMNETFMNIINPLMQQNKEMMKVVSDAAITKAEVEREKMHHELQLKMHNDDIKLEQQKEEMKNERWKETMEAINESGAIDGIVAAIMKKFGGSGDGEEKSGSGSEEKPKQKPVSMPARSGSPEPKKSEESKASKAKNKKGRPKIKKRKKSSDSNEFNFFDRDKNTKEKSENVKLSKSTQKAIEDGDDMTEDQIKEVFTKSGMKKAEENPTSMLVSVLGMMIEEKDQWDDIEKLITPEQFSIFKKMTEIEDDDEMDKMIKKLKNTKGILKLAKLERVMDEDQKPFVDRLMDIVMKS